jgi:endonuclease/exonuclease/phosphatase family metal-dependent hydrolase
MTVRCRPLPGIIILVSASLFAGWLLKERAAAAQVQEGAKRPAATARVDGAKVEPKASKPKSWKIATYNINWGDPDLASVAATIQRADADVVCLQETTTESEHYLRQKFAKVYGHISFHGHEGKYAAERFGILSRVPVGKVTFLPPKHGLFGAYCADLQLDGRPVQLISVHLEPMLFQEGGNLLDAWKAMNAMEATHRREISRFWESRRKDSPLLIAGDFNSPSNFQAPSFLREKGLKDSFAQVHENPDSQATWHWPIKWGELSFRIDYIFHSAEIQTVRSEIIKSNGSDHYLVVSECRWPVEQRAEGRSR